MVGTQFKILTNMYMFRFNPYLLDRIRVIRRTDDLILPADSLLRRDLRNVYSAYGAVTIALVASLYIYISIIFKKRRRLLTSNLDKVYTWKI